MNKLIKSLLIINGFLFPIIIIAFGGLIFQSFSSHNNRDEGIILDEPKSNTTTDSIALQGLSFNSPEPIPNSQNHYLTIEAYTYQEKLDLTNIASRSGNVGWSMRNLINVVFLDENFNHIGTLVDKKASIRSLEIPRENYGNRLYDIKTINNIAYLIGFEDTNGDKRLNRADHHDLYVSDLNGQNLIQATSGIDVADFEFVNRNNQVLIQYKERNNLAEEHKRIHFALFDIKSSEFRKLTGLNQSLDAIEMQLIH